MPARNPATWAQNAMPPPGWPGTAVAIDPTPLRNCIRNQIPRKKIAGTSITWKYTNSGMSVTMRERG